MKFINAATDSKITAYDLELSTASLYCCIIHLSVCMLPEITWSALVTYRLLQTQFIEIIIADARI